MKSTSLLQSLRQHRSTLAAVQIAMLSLFIVQANAGNTWDGGGGDNNWGTGANWSPDGSPAPGSGNDLFFGGSTRLSPFNNYTAFDDWRNITFNSGASSFNLFGNAIDLFGKIENLSSNSQTVGLLSIALNSATANEFNPVNGNMTINSTNIFTNGNQLKVFGNNGFTLSFSSGTNIQQAGSIAINQNSIVEYNSAHSYTGDTFINAGRLNFNSGASATSSIIRLGDTSGAVNTALGLTANGGLTLSNTVVARNGSSGTRTIQSTNTTGTNTLSGGLFLDAGLIVQQSGAGTLSLTGNSDVKQQAITFNSTGSTSVSGILDSSFATGGTLIKSGAGTLTLSNSGNRYTGTNAASLNASGTQIAAGTLAIGSDTALGLAPSAAYNNIQFTGSGTLQANATISLNANRNVSVASGQTATFNNNGNTFTINGIVSGSTGNVESSGAGTTVLTGANTYSGTTTVSAGTLQIGSGAGTGSLGTGAVTNNATLAFNRNNSMTVANDISGTGNVTQSGSGTTILTGTNSYGTTTISAGTLQIGSGGSTGTLGTGSVTNNGSLVFNRAFGGNVNVSNAISGSGTLTQNGGNIVTLSTTNSYTGTTTINSGTLRVTANNALGTSAAGTTVNSGGSLVLSGVNYSTAEALSINGTGVGGNGALRNNLGSSTYAGQVTAASNATINVTGIGESLTLTGGVVKNGTVLTIKGTGSVIVNGTGISGASANSDLVVDGGNLVVNAASNYNGPTTVQNGGTLVANAQIDTTTATINAGSTLSGTGKVVAASGSSLFLNGQFIVGDSTLGSPVASQFETSTSGAGSTVIGSTGVMQIDLFSGAGLGNNTGNAAAADIFKITGALSLVAGSTLDVANPNSLTGWAWGDKWKIWDTTSMAPLTGVITTINAPTLGVGLFWDLDEGSGVLSIVPEPSKALFAFFGLFGLLMRRRRA